MTESQYPWDVLRIDETDDKKLIKKAYAVLIKQYKPDEHPEKFKEIQEAYQMALSMRNWYLEETEITQSNENTKEDLSDFETEGFELSEVPIDEEQLKFEQQQQALIENLYKQLHEMAFAPLAIKDKLENWKFIEDFYRIDDLLIKPEVAQKFLEKVAKYNLFQMKQTSTLQVNPNVLVYMDSVFDWKSYGTEYSNSYRQDFFDITFHYFDTKYKKKNTLSMLDSRFVFFHRLWTFMIDVMINIFLVFAFVSLTTFYFNYTSISDFNIIMLFIVPLILTRLFLEMFSKEKTSFGKKVTRRIILDEYGNLINWKLALIRHVILLLCLLPTIILPLLGYGWSNLFVFISFLFVLIVNVICILIKQGFIHDYLSKSMVYKIERHTIIV